MKQASDPCGVPSISTDSITRSTPLHFLRPSDRLTRTKSESVLPHMESITQTMSPMLPIVRCESPTEFPLCHGCWDDPVVELAEAAHVVCPAVSHWQKVSWLLLIFHPDLYICWFQESGFPDKCELYLHHNGAWVFCVRWLSPIFHHYIKDIIEILKKQSCPSLKDIMLTLK
jgi:hypothetical protein